MKIILILVCIISTYSLASQTLSPESVFSATGNYNNQYAHISWTLGDAQTVSYISDDLILTQGFLQTKFTITSIMNYSTVTDVEIKVFPNPVKDILNISIDSDRDTDIHFQLFSLGGKLLFTKKLSSDKQLEILNFESFQSGLYVLKAFSSENTLLKSFKIIYQD